MNLQLMNLAPGSQVIVHGQHGKCHHSWCVYPGASQQKRLAADWDIILGYDVRETWDMERMTM